MVQGAATVEGQLFAAQSELQGLKQIYAENNVRVRSLRARIAELQSQLQERSRAKVVSAETGDHVSRNIPLLRLRGCVGTRKGSVGGYPSAGSAEDLYPGCP